ncbi:hypothetical protein IAQ61_010815 [Plenodomus lingam]|uniref:Predicted protein n=1 Tax=Leptosphaeria maculans (strain JN3 / isolate v23.1.3 / race Av1-4-5-6-7-8) TaxID=985895 RepID=E4ZJ37_LEPMJ|nr:predicted protein [Plenodomus lingam JN3]KAH9861079.1 hypothetical protein IAQ61_010815 [Plenodomus lingam]CBX91468.1 predicted protein [Plenodomus lingam JN3]
MLRSGNTIPISVTQFSIPVTGHCQLTASTNLHPRLVWGAGRPLALIHGYPERFAGPRAAM